MASSAFIDDLSIFTDTQDFGTQATVHSDTGLTLVDVVFNNPSDEQFGKSGVTHYGTITNQPKICISKSDEAVFKVNTVVVINDTEYVVKELGIDVMDSNMTSINLSRKLKSTFKETIQRCDDSVKVVKESEYLPKNYNH